MRATWKGAISFGLVNIPVELYSAVKDGDKISFRMLHKDCKATIKYDRVCEKEQKSVPWDEVGKGYEYQKGKFIMMDDEDFRAAAIESSKSLEIQEFVREDQIDPRFFDTPYFLTPQKGAEKGYALVREAIKRTGTVGLGLVTMRQNSQHLAAVRAVGEALVLEVMRYSDSLVPADNFTFPSADDVKPQEIALAEQLVTSQLSDFAPDKYANQYRENLMSIINDKLKGKKIKIAEPVEPPQTNVTDLLAKLQESLTMPKRERKAAAPAVELPKQPKKRAARKAASA